MEFDELIQGDIVELDGINGIVWEYNKKHDVYYLFEYRDLSKVGQLRRQDYSKDKYIKRLSPAMVKQYEVMISEEYDDRV